MIYLVIEDATGLVVNAITWDGVTPYDPGEGLTLVERSGAAADAWIGWTKNGDLFNPPTDQ